MKQTDSASGRVFADSRETEPGNPERIEERARQLAGRDGRAAEQVTDEDRNQAWKELQEEGGLGVASPETVEKRARELAVIDGRSPDQVTEADREQARIELQEQTLAPPAEEPVEAVEGPRNPADPPARPGAEAARKRAPDEAQYEEAEAKEGLREAEHDSMLKARERPPEQEG